MPEYCIKYQSGNQGCPGSTGLTALIRRFVLPLCLVLFAGGCSSDTTVKPVAETGNDDRTENLPVMQWYPTPKGGMVDRRYWQSHPVPTMPSTNATRFYSNPPQQYGRQTQAWPGQYAGQPPAMPGGSPQNPWQVPGQFAPPYVSGYRQQPYPPRYVQRPWGESAAPNTTFGTEPPVQEPWQNEKQFYQQGNSQQFNPWSGTSAWRSYENDVSPARSPGYVW